MDIDFTEEELLEIAQSVKRRKIVRHIVDTFPNDQWLSEIEKVLPELRRFEAMDIITSFFGDTGVED